MYLNRPVYDYTVAMAEFLCKSSQNGNTLSTVNIVAKDKIDKISTLNMIVFVYNNWFNLSR